ncbi:small kinetochore-associated protein [Scleropages formosus]|uniref:Uncharacterized LOC108920771 n=1 Tax=Scleropages formosus TaxID=113540 RepID=A0A8C9R579_SCLFO|nr:uncharacterized protein LOC108920771 [Scleropages formosus]
MASKIPVSAEGRHAQPTKDDAAPLGPSNMKRSAQDAEVTCAAANVKYGAKTDVCVQAKEGRLHNNFKRKKPPVKDNRGPQSRLEAELQDQNRHLQANVEELKRNLSEYEDRVIKMEQQYSDLQTEKCEMRKQLESCLLLLVAGDIDPVLGQRIAETKEQKEEQQNDVMNASRELLNELEMFSEKMSRQRRQLEEVEQKMATLKRSQEQHAAERGEFSLEVEEMERAMEEAEALLLSEI